jgi:hypothetical protein
MTSSKLRSRPPGEAGVEEFISGATTETRHETPPMGTKPERWAGERYPWQAPAVRVDITKVYNLRLPEPALLKLKYIAEHTPDSMQKFCLDLLLPAIDAKIDELTQEHGEHGETP